MDNVIQDVRVTLRNLAKSPGYVLPAVLTIALGIGINTAIFSAVHGTLLAPLPYPDPGTLVVVWADLVGSNYPRAPLSGPELVDLRRDVKLLGEVGGIWPTGATLVEDGRPEALRVGMVTANFLSILRVTPALGRVFTAAEEGEGAPPAIVIGGRLWQSRFGGADVVNRRVRISGGWGLSGGVYTIVGVMPPDFEMLLPLDSSVPRSVDAWIPFQQDLATAPRSVSYLRTIGRLVPGAGFASAADQIDVVGRDIVRKHAEYAKSARRFYAVPLHEDLVRGVRPALILLQGAVGFVLLMTCANVSSLMLVRARARRRETATRAALGAPRHRVVRLLLTESLALALPGGLLGVLLAQLGLGLTAWLDLSALPRRAPAALNAPVLGFAVLASLVAALLFGLAPLLGAFRVSLVDVLKTGLRDGSAAASRQATSLLVLVEIALGVVLLIGAGLLVRTFLNLQHADLGYNAERVLTFQLSLPFERYGDPSALSRFTRDLERELLALPGVEAAGAINQLPLDEAPNWSTPYWTPATEKQRDAPEADARLVTPGYFRSVQAHLIAGRWFRSEDDETQPLVLIVDERLARQAWPGESPLEKELSVLVSGAEGFAIRRGHVVGVVRHLRHHRPSAEVREQVYVPFAQAPRNQMGVVVRAPVDVEALMRAITLQISRLDPNLAPARMRTMGDYLARSWAPARISMLLASLFACLSLALACVGLYGVISYSVALRRDELAIRAALGASMNDLVWLVLRHGAGLTAAGLALGLLASLLASRGLASLLFGVSARDPATFVGVPVALGLCAFVASYLPARRAARVDPARILRGE